MAGDSGQGKGQGSGRAATVRDSHGQWTAAGTVIMSRDSDHGHQQRHNQRQLPWQWPRQVMLILWLPKKSQGSLPWDTP
jgi:hypothetical protein